MSQTTPPPVHPLTPSGLPRSGGSGAEPTAPRTSRGTDSDKPLPSHFAPLDQLETSSQPRVNRADDEQSEPYELWKCPDCIPFEHRGWQPMRKRVMASMIRTEQPINRRFAFWGCCDRIHVMTHPTTGEVDLHPETCHDRFCLPCGQRRSRRIAGAVEELMKQATNKLMFLTLTVRGKPSDSLQSMLDRLRDAWKELRRLKGWRNTIKGGVCMLEVKWSYTSGGHWHPHYHLIVEGAWLDEKWLKDAWFLLTRDSDQCKVKRVTEAAEALRYVSKYASKPVDGSFVMRPKLMDEAMTTLKGVRLAACFGTWHGTPLSKGVSDADQDETEILTAWVYQGTVDDLRTRASGHDARAKDILAAVERQLRLRFALIERCRGPGKNGAFTERTPTHPDPTADGFGAFPLIGVA